MDEEFREFIQRVRSGDQSAAQELVEQYEAELRIIARARIRDSRVRRTVDASDICQSVFASFFARAAVGQYDFESPEDLIKLLVAMVGNKANGQLRKQHAACRSVAKQENEGVDEMALADQGPTPSRVIIARELVDRMHAVLPEDIKKIADLRQSGANWDAIAQEFGTTSEAIRKRFTRAIDQAAIQLGIDEEEEVVP